MACISKLANAIAYDCDSGATGLVSALIINKADIASYAISGGVVNSLTLLQGANAYKVDTVKRSLVVSDALKINEGAPNAFSHSASMVITSAAGTGLVSTVAALANGSFVIMAKQQGDTYPMVYGLYYGLSATAIDSSSHDNGGWVSATIETPENVIGEDNLLALRDLYDTLYAAAVE